MNQYHELLRHILRKGESHDDRTGVGTLSVLGYQIRFHLRDGFPLMTTKKLPFRWIAEELFWFLSGDTNEATLRDKGVDIWKEWADEEHTGKFGRTPGDLGPVYGFLWRHFGGSYLSPEEQGLSGLKDAHGRGGIDQIARLMREISTNPGSRRILVSGWDPKQCDNVSLPPCHTVWQIKVLPNRCMGLSLYARSIDAFLGLPFNIASYALLLHMIAICTGYEPTELVISFGDLHIYKNHMEQVTGQLMREPRPLPTLNIKMWQEEEDAFWTPLSRLLAIKFEHLELVGYDPYPKIKAEVAV